MNLIIIAAFSYSINLVLAQTFYKEVTIGEDQIQESPKVIEGVDNYNVAQFKKFDPGPSLAQQQVEEAEKVQKAPYYLLYFNDYDSYQEKQTQALFEWQKRVGIYRQD